MVQREKVLGLCRRSWLWFGLIAWLSILVLAAQSARVWAQDDYPGFGTLVSWTQYTEMSLDGNDLEASQQIAQIIYRDPQFFWFSFGFGREEIDFGQKFDGYEVDDAALCFHIGGAYYLAPNLELGVPADFSLNIEYSRARYDVDDYDVDDNDKLTHQRILGSVGLEWDFPPATPYFRVGALHSILDANATLFEEEKTTALFVGGIRVSPTQRFSLGMEFNLSEDIGFGANLGFYF